VADDKTQTGRDRELISLGQDYEVRDWAKSLGCTEEQLRAAVQAVGNSADAVRKFLANGR
jgi:alkylhydroperoxidase/carboxymuconolactone decarboxylase family protein YurZ